jgi:hypothetical protein
MRSPRKASATRVDPRLVPGYTQRHAATNVDWTLLRPVAGGRVRLATTVHGVPVRLTLPTAAWLGLDFQAAPYDAEEPQTARPRRFALNPLRT